MEEKILKRIIQKNYSKLSLGTRKAECPSEETLASYLEKKLTPDTVKSLEGHLALCSVCSEQIVLLNRVLMSPQTISPPSFLVERAKNLVSGTSLATDILEIILAFGRDVCEVVRTTGKILETAGLTPIPVSVRSGPGTERSATTKISKNFESAYVEVNIEKLSDASFRIKVISMDSASKKPLNDVRVSLFRDKRELESLLSQEGVTTFSGLTFNRYKIAVLKANSPIGEILLDLRKA
jgi:hypothetical protein